MNAWCNEYAYTLAYKTFHQHRLIIYFCLFYPKIESDYQYAFLSTFVFEVQKISYFIFINILRWMIEHPKYGDDEKKAK